MKSLRILTLVFSCLGAFGLLLFLQMSAVLEVVAGKEMPESLQLQINRSSPVTDGEPITYSLSVTNGGTTAVSPVLISHLPDQVTPTGSLLWQPGILNPTGSWTTQTTVTVNDGYTGVLTHQLTAVYDWGKNLSYCTTCAEEDNINVPLYAANVTIYYITATHPTYLEEVPQTVNECAADFSGCSLERDSTIQGGGDPCLSEPPIFDDGVDVIRVCSEPNWWRGSAMTVTLSNTMPITAHRLVWNKRILGTDEYPQFFVLYEDGNLRLKPQPPEGRTDTCFGSSVIVGISEPTFRPFADIEKIDINPNTMSLTLMYADGSMSVLQADVDRAQATITVVANYDSSLPFATLRSMYVASDNNDVSHVQVNNEMMDLLVGDNNSWQAAWEATPGGDWFFYRNAESQHNISSPDIRIKIKEVTASTTVTDKAYSNEYPLFLPKITK